MGASVAQVPLVVDLDGSLLRTDTLHEATLAMATRDPASLLKLPIWLRKGRAQLKHRVAEEIRLDIENLPYDEQLLSWIRSERDRGRRIVLCTASDAAFAEQVAGHLGLFDEVMASDGTTNLKGTTKAVALVQRFGEHGFDYVGNSSSDLPVWERARHAIVVGASERLARVVRRRFMVEREFNHDGNSALLWIEAVRLHQWIKNLLLLLPIVGAHRLFEPDLLVDAILGFVAFGLSASAIYVVNDLIDLESDRRHPRKRLRPFASGALPAADGALVSLLMLCASATIGLMVNTEFVLWLGLYVALTLGYTFWLKRRILVDAIALSGLYVLRIVAGGAAVSIAPSFWLLAFAMFLFLSLAFVKRLAELQVAVSQGWTELHGRGYQTGDIPFVELLGVVSGYSAVVVMALYINGDSIAALYRYPQTMWFTIPILLYWVSYIWMKTHRGEMDDDPVLYAARDPTSYVSGALFLLVMWLAA